jgi:hypothetical protein
MPLVLLSFTFVHVDFGCWLAMIAKPCVATVLAEYHQSHQLELAMTKEDCKKEWT